MTIGIDGNEANVQELVGVSVYTATLLSYFQKSSSSDLRFEIFLKEHPSDLLPYETSFFQYRVVKPSFFWSQAILPLSLMKHKDLDVFFSPAHYAPRFCPAPLVITIHDLSYFYYPDEFLKKDLYKLINWTRYSIEKAKKIICVSRNTKKDLMKFYKVPESKITVIYNGYEKQAQRSKVKIQSRNLKFNPKQYILYVGTLQPRKNVLTLIKAFSKFVMHNPSFKLVIVGKKGWLYEKMFSLVEQLSLEKSVVFTGYVSNEKLAVFYRNAFCLVLPSLYEGFGIPILEAMSNGCPVISSKVSSLPEIGGDACLYFDPNNVDELINKLTSLKQNSHLRTNLVQKGKERITNFSWKKSAKQTLKLLQSL